MAAAREALGARGDAPAAVAMLTAALTALRARGDAPTALAQVWRCASPNA